MSKIDFVKSGKLKYIILSVIAVLLIAAILLAALIVDKKQSSDGGGHINGVIEYDGKEYALRGGVESFLILGIDKTDENIESDSYNNNQQADFLLLIVFDHVKRTYSTVHINRDTIADVDIYGVTGKKVGTEKMQIALSHTYGEGGSFSNRNTAKSVSRLFMGTRINNSVSFTLDSVGEMNRLVGGVELEVLDDFTHLPGGERMIKGDIITLSDEEALLYVQHRKELDDNTNNGRMQRQKQYIDALRIKFEELLENDTDNSFLKNAVETMSAHMETEDITDFQKISDKMHTYKFVEIDGISGKSVYNEKNKRMEFLPDEDSLKKTTVDLFYVFKN